MSDYIPVIGLEIHVELNTKSKMFCQCSADYFGKEPNSNVCPVCLGLPGSLPVPNEKAVEYCQMIGLALGCTLNLSSKFDRKHYFYPDLPKGYQISQYDEPFCVNGKTTFYNPSTKQEKTVRIHRVHMEEDTGKLLHGEKETKVDFNRSGVPLVEIVTEPDFDNSSDVKAFLEELQTIIRYLDVSDADMEKGSMRLEPNISLRLKKETKLPSYKVEVKNINSFRFVQKAVEYELSRQLDLLNKGETPHQETRGFNEAKRITFSQRSKEEAHDYRYFPEPDIPPFEFERKYLEELKTSIPELPNEKMKKFLKQGIKPTDAFILAHNKIKGKLVEELIPIMDEGSLQTAVNVVVNKRVLDLKSAQELISKTKVTYQLDDDMLSRTLNEVLENNEAAVSDFKKGKQNAVMFLVGQVMKELKGKADATIVKEKLLQKLEIKN